MNASANDRRGFSRKGCTRLMREVATRTEQRVAPRRSFGPRGAADEIAFLASCTRCGDCMPVCPVHAIIKAPPGAGLAAGTPMIDPAIQACVVCADMPCAHACATGALVPPAGGAGGWDEIHMGVLELDPERCITFQGVSCGVCARACPVGERALAMGPGGRPRLRAEGFGGCRRRVAACVTSPSSLRLSLPGNV